VLRSESWRSSTRQSRRVEPSGRSRASVEDGVRGVGPIFSRQGWLRFTAKQSLVLVRHLTDNLKPQFSRDGQPARASKATPSKSYRWEGRTLRCSTSANWSAASSNCRRTPSWLSPGFVRTTIEGEAESPNPSCTHRKSPSSLLPAIPPLCVGTFSAPLNRLRWNREPSDLLITGVSSFNRHSVPGSPLALQWGQISKFLNTNGEYSR
jgi:hypothetical protein